MLLVDDASTDGSAALVRDLVDESKICLIEHRVNPGKGAAVRSALSKADGDLFTILDADLEYDPVDFRNLLEPLLAGHASVVYGTRSFGANTAYSFWYVLGNKALGLWASFLFNTWLSDVETCLKLAPTALWRRLDLKSRGFGIEAESTGKFLKSGQRIFEVPISYTARTRQEGKKLNWTDGVIALVILARIRLSWRPTK